MVLYVVLVYNGGRKDIVSDGTFAISLRVSVFSVYVLKHLVFAGFYLLILCALCLAFF